MTAKNQAAAKADREPVDYVVLQLRTSRVRDLAGKKIARGRLVAVETKRAVSLIDKEWAVEAPKGFDPRDVLDLVDQVA